MAQDRIGNIVRALVDVPQERLSVIQNVINGLNSAAAWGEEFQTDLSKFVTGWKPAPTAVVNSRMPTALIQWGATYEKLFGKRPDFSGVRIPETPGGSGPIRLIVVAKEIVEWTGGRPIQGTQDALKKHFPCYQYESDLDHAIPTNDRDPRNGSYAVWIEDGQESDDRYANKSANDLEAEGHVGPTVIECQLHEFDYFMETKNHLDVKNVRMATGSRDRDGYVPSALWLGRFSVGWCRASTRFSFLRSRRVWV